MAKGMAQVQKRTFALLGFIARDDARLHRDRMGHRVLAQGHVVAQAGGVRFQPFEEITVPQKPVFRDLAIARQEVARGERVQHGDIGQHQGWLVKGADQVLAVRAVDAGLAADAAVHLGQQRRGDLHEAHAPAQDRGGKSH